jgi:hypothetical protein
MPQPPKYWDYRHVPHLALAFFFLIIKSICRKWWYAPIIPEVGRKSQEDWGFKVSLGYMVKLSQNKTKKSVVGSICKNHCKESLSHTGHHFSMTWTPQRDFPQLLCFRKLFLVGFVMSTAIYNRAWFYVPGHIWIHHVTQGLHSDFSFLTIYLRLTASASLFPSSLHHLVSYPGWGVICK